MKKLLLLISLFSFLDSFSMEDVKEKEENSTQSLVRFQILKLINYGSDLNGVYGFGIVNFTGTPLKLAACYNCHNLIDLLIQHKADINLQPNYGDHSSALYSKLFAGVTQENVKTVFQLLNNGADPNIGGSDEVEDHNCLNPICLCAAWGGLVKKGHRQQLTVIRIESI